MGLDNGILIKVQNKDLQNYVANNFTSWYDGYELFYWRKCYNVRGAILSVLGKYDITIDVEDDIEATFDTNVFGDILDALDKLYTAEGWDTSQSIWTYWADEDEDDDNNCNVIPQWFRSLFETLRDDAKYSDLVAKLFDNKPREVSPIMIELQNEVQKARALIEVLNNYEDGVDYTLSFYDSY